MAEKSSNKVTSKPVASKASETLSSKSTGQDSKSAAASALSQTNAPDKQTQPKAASAASKTLSDGRTSAKAKSAAASTLSQTQRNNKKK